jgi:hypothetical protein
MDKKIRLDLTSTLAPDTFQGIYARMAEQYYHEQYQTEHFGEGQDEEFLYHAIEANAPLFISGVDLPTGTIVELAQHVERITYVPLRTLPEKDIDQLIQIKNITLIAPFKQTILPHYTPSNEVTLENTDSIGYADWFMAGWLKKKIDPRSASYSIFSKSAPVINDVEAAMHKAAQAAYDKISGEPA